MEEKFNSGPQSPEGRLRQGKCPTARLSLQPRLFLFETALPHSLVKGPRATLLDATKQTPSWLASMGHTLSYPQPPPLVGGSVRCLFLLVSNLYDSLPPGTRSTPQLCRKLSGVTRTKGLFKIRKSKRLFEHKEQSYHGKKNRSALDLQNLARLTNFSLTNLCLWVSGHFLTNPSPEQIQGAVWKFERN